MERLLQTLLGVSVIFRMVPHFHLVSVKASGGGAAYGPRKNPFQFEADHFHLFLQIYGPWWRSVTSESTLYLFLHFYPTTESCSVRPLALR